MKLRRTSWLGYVVNRCVLYYANVKKVGLQKLADRGYDSDAIVEKTEKAVIPPRKNLRVQREYDKELYKLRYFIENAFMILKRWRGIATRYAKNTASFPAAVQITPDITYTYNRLE